MTHNILTYEGYWAYFFEICGDYPTYREAYEHIENLLYSTYQTNRYGDYGLFRNAKNYYMNIFRRQ